MTSVLHLVGGYSWRESLVADPTLDLPLDLPGIPCEIKVPAGDKVPTLGDVLCDALLYVGDAPFECRILVMLDDIEIARLGWV